MGMNKEISEDDALRIAEAAISGHVKRQLGAPVEITRAGDVYTVTFVHITPPTQLGADYDAQVTVNAITGEVLQIKVGP